MRLLLLLLLAACSTTPSTYQRGTLAPPPPEHRPGVGLPVYEPHTAQPKRQPQPRPTRLLPPAEAPALWASSASPTAESVPALLGWQAPSRLEGGPEKDGLPGFCVEVARGKIEATTTPDFLARLDPETKRCFAATAWAQCLEAFLLDFDRARTMKGQASSAFWDYRKIGAHVRNLVRAACNGVDGFDSYQWRGP